MQGAVSIIINAPITRILSAIGSKNLPKSVTRLYFLAIYPSKKSVNAATKKIIAVIK